MPLGARSAWLRDPGSQLNDAIDSPGKEITSGNAKPAERVSSPPTQPPPSRDELEAARRALEEGLERHKAEQNELAARERALAEERRSINQRQEKEIRGLRSAIEAAEQDYEARSKAWRDRQGK